MSGKRRWLRRQDLNQPAGVGARVRLLRNGNAASSLTRSRLYRYFRDSRPYLNDINLNPHLLFAPNFHGQSLALIGRLFVVLVGLIRSAFIGSRRVETAINLASSPNSRPLAACSRRTLAPLLTPRLHGGTPKVTEKVYSEHVEDEQWSSLERYNGE
jgi:hypothetical protein